MLHPSYDGISATLAPSALDLSASQDILGSVGAQTGQAKNAAGVAGQGQRQGQGQTGMMNGSSSIFSINPDADSNLVKTTPAALGSATATSTVGVPRTGDAGNSNTLSRTQTPSLPSQAMAGMTAGGGDDWCQFINDTLWE